MMQRPYKAVDLSETTQMNALTAEVTIQHKNLDEITDADEFTAALKLQCINVPPEKPVRPQTIMVMVLAAMKIYFAVFHPIKPWLGFKVLS